MKIVAIDFETANTSPVSAISLGVSIYEDGEIKDGKIFYFRPPKGYQDFIFTYIHHMTYDDIKDEDGFDRYYDELQEIFEDAILVAHNAHFDIGVLNACCDYYGLKHFNNPYLDTVRISRIVYPRLRNHKLDTVSRYLKVSLDHHEALSDSYACLMILLDSMSKAKTYDLDRFLSKIHMKLSYNY